MWIQSFFNSLTSTPTRRRPTRRRPLTSRLCLETLEDRCLLSFGTAVSYPVGLSPQAVVTGDFNGDGRLDLAVASQGSNSVSILLGNANGTFQPAKNYASGGGPWAMAVVDFNGDGKLDLVAANPTNVSVLLGNGDGTFQAPHSFVLPVLPAQSPPGYSGSTALPQVPNSIVLGDLNGDGKLDLAVRGQTTFAVLTGTGYYGNYYTTYYDSYVNVLLGNGDVSFSPNAAYRLGTELGTDDASALKLGDFNGDGKLDVLAVVNRGNDASVLPGNGDGTLRAVVHSATGLAANSVVTGDLNGDGKLDLVLGGNGLFVQKGNGDGTFQAPANIPLPGWSPAGYIGVTPLPLIQNAEGVVVGDLNGDGKLDLAVTTASSYWTFAGSGYYGNYYSTVSKTNVNVLLGHGDGAFTDAQIAPLNDSSATILPLTEGNFNSDTFPDLAVADPGTNSVSVLLNRNDWTVPAFIDVSGFPTSSTAGLAGIFAATIRDSSGNIDTGYRGTVQLSSTDSLAVLPGLYTFTAADAGTHTFSATLKTAGTQSLTVIDTTSGNLTGRESGIAVNPAAASIFTVTGFPSSTTAGDAHSFTITALDSYANIATGYTGTVHFSSSAAQAVLPANSTLTNGTGQFSATLNTAGTQSLTATDTTNAGLAGTQGGINVRAAVAAVKTLAVAGFPALITAGGAGSITVTAKDGNGKVATWYTGTVVFSSSDPHAVLPAMYTFTAADKGVHTFSATLKTAGTQSITVKDTATVALKGSEGGITVRPAAASNFRMSAPARVRAGVAFSLTVKVQDAYGNVITDYTGTIHFTSTDKTTTLPADYTFTAADKGVHTFRSLVLRTKGTRKITLADTLNSSLAGSVIENVVSATWSCGGGHAHAHPPGHVE